MRTRSIMFALLITLMLSGSTSGQYKKISHSFVSNPKSELVEHIREAEDKFVSLAKATPLTKYKWRPAEGVRSIGDVFWHMVQANYGLPAVIGVKPPRDAPKDANKFTEKKQLVDALRKSFEYTRKVVESFSEADLKKPVKFRGKDTTYRGVLNFMNNHTNQHLGQSIAYARTNGIIPPWTQTR